MHQKMISKAQHLNSFVICEPKDYLWNQAIFIIAMYMVIYGKSSQGDV